MRFVPFIAAAALALCAGVHATAGGLRGEALNLRPIIGIMTQPVGGSNDSAYLAASYVKFVEAAGGRVVPVHYNGGAEYLARMFNSVNGLIFPGGGASLDADSPFYQAQHLMFNLTLQANDAGDFFPLWGTCMGFEALCIMAAQDHSVLEEGFDSENLPLALELTPIAANSRLLGTAPADVLHTLSATASTMNNHQCGVKPQVFAAHPKLSAFFNVLSVNSDRQGVPFVSTIEAVKYPIYGVQWHPEKNAFEWTPDQQLPHAPEAVRAAQHVANFFVDHARRNFHKFASVQEEQTHLIYNYAPVFTGEQGSAFVQEYVYRW